MHTQITRLKLPVPSPMRMLCTAMVRSHLRTKLGFDLFDVRPVLVAPRVTCPAVILAANDDDYIQPEHSYRVAEMW